MKKSILFALITSLLALQPVFSQGKEVDKFLKAIWNKNEEVMKSYCSEHFWDNPYGETGDKFYHKVLDADWKLERREKEVKGERAVYHLVRFIPGKNPDEIYFYLLKKGEGWIIDGIDTDVNHIPYFLNGKIGGHFEPEHIKEHEALHTFGEMLIAFSREEDVPIADFITGEYESYIDLLKNVEEVEVEKARYSVDIDKGAIHFLHMYYEDHEDLTIYFHFKDGKWEPYTYSFHAPHAKDFYMNKIDE